LIRPDVVVCTAAIMNGPVPGLVSLQADNDVTGVMAAAVHKRDVRALQP
jgi:hypothetical protein